MNRATVLNWARAAFVIAVIVFGWLGLRSQWPEIVTAISDIAPFALLAALMCVLLGLLATSVIWRSILASYGMAVPSRNARSIFFVGQLGKYIPGSVWSLGAQAEMASRFTVPARVSVATGLVFLYVHVATAVLVGCLGAAFEWSVIPAPRWLAVTGGAAAIVGLLPVTIRLVGRWLAGGRHPLHLSPRPYLSVMVAMAAAWVCYGLALVVTIPSGTRSTMDLLILTASVLSAFALAYAVGVVVVLAPAGFGAREALFIALLTPTLGLAAATAVALVNRVLHTLADFGIAAVAWLVARRS